MQKQPKYLRHIHTPEQLHCVSAVKSSRQGTAWTSVTKEYRVGAEASSSNPEPPRWARICTVLQSCQEPHPTVCKGRLGEAQQREAKSTVSQKGLRAEQWQGGCSQVEGRPSPGQRGRVGRRWPLCRAPLTQGSPSSANSTASSDSSLPTDAGRGEARVLTCELLLKAGELTSGGSEAATPKRTDSSCEHSGLPVPAQE